MSEPIDLARCLTGDFFRGDPDSAEWRGEAVTWWRALPRAEYDALVRRVENAEVAARVCREDAEENAARAERAERDRDAYRRAKTENDERFMVERDAATARADAADVRAKAAEALLREARGLIGCRVSHLPLIRDRIDALLGAPTPDDRPTEADRRGEDGAWCKP